MHPLLIRLAPSRLKTSFYYRVYRRRRANWPHLYTAATLHHAPNIRMRLSATDEMHGEIAFTGFFELDLTQRIVAKAKDGGLLVDVGANYGYYSLLWAALRMGNRVVAFEASPKNQTALTDNIAANQLGHVINVRPQAVGQECGVLQFSLGPEDQTGWGGISLGGGEGEKVAVPVVRLDEALADMARIDVLKIDIEGADTWAILGAEKLLRDRRIGWLYFEENKQRMAALGINSKEAKAHLSKFGYHVEALGHEDADLVEYQAFPR